MPELPDINAYRCSYEGCEATATAVSGMIFGPWMLGIWFCKDHAKQFDEEFPIFYNQHGKPVHASHAIGMIRRSGMIDSIAELRGQQPEPLLFTCDRCGTPIARNDGKWVHVSATQPEHEAYPG